MPAILTARYVIEAYDSAYSIPQHVWDTLRANAVNSNIILPHAEIARSQDCSNPSSADLWISCTTFTATSPPTVDFVLSCTSNHLCQYPIFIFTTLSTKEQAADDVIPRLRSLTTALLQRVPVERVFSVFAPEVITRTFASIWSDITGVSLEDEENPEYYAAKVSYCTEASLIRKPKELLDGVQYELRLAREADLMGAAYLCHGFAIESPPFILNMEEAIREASYMIKNHQLWVHEIRVPGQSSEIASIVAVTRTSSTVSTITKVYTNPHWRGKGCAERLVRKVTKHLLKTKEKVALYVAHDNPAAAKVYHRVGFLGLGPGTESVEGIDNWLELGFDRSQVILGRW